MVRGRKREREGLPGGEAYGMSRRGMSDSSERIAKVQLRMSSND